MSKNKFGIGKFLVMALVLGGGLIYGTQMVQKNQENRSSAASMMTVCLCYKGSSQSARQVGGSYNNKASCSSACRGGSCKCKTVGSSSPTPLPVVDSGCGTTKNSCVNGIMNDVADTEYYYVWVCGSKSCRLKKSDVGICGDGINKCTEGVLSDISDTNSLYQWKCGSRTCTWTKQYINCTSVIYSNWSPCKAGKQTRTIFEKNPSGCTVVTPILSQSCTN